MQSDIVQRLDYWRNEMQRTIQALESNPKFSDVVDGNRSIHTTLGMAKTEILFSRTTIANQSEAMRASDAEIARLTEALRAAEEREKALREALEPFGGVGELIDTEYEGMDGSEECELLFDGYLMERFTIQDFRRAALKEQPHD